MIIASAVIAAVWGFWTARQDEKDELEQELKAISKREERRKRHD